MIAMITIVITIDYHQHHLHHYDGHRHNFFLRDHHPPHDRRIQCGPRRTAKCEEAAQMARRHLPLEFNCLSSSLGLGEFGPKG